MCISINVRDAFLIDTPPNQHLYIVIRESVIVYQFAREWDATELARLITSGSQIPKGCCSPEILLQIQQGGLVSKRLTNKYQNALKAFLYNY